MKHPHVVVACCLSLVSLAVLPARAAAPSHITARVVSLDSSQRTMVIVDAQGTRQTVELNDQLSGFNDVQAGDRVLLTMQYDPGHARVSSIVKSGTTVAAPQGAPVGAAVVVAVPVAASAPAASTSTRAAEQAFKTRVATLAEQATGVDLTWNSFRDTCEAKVRTPYANGRDWFGLWDKSMTADLSGGFCRDLFNQIAGRGGDVVRNMASAEEAALQSGLLPGTVRDIRRAHSLDWEGWTQPAPERLNP